MHSSFRHTFDVGKNQEWQDGRTPVLKMRNWQVWWRAGPEHRPSLLSCLQNGLLGLEIVLENALCGPKLSPGTLPRIANLDPSLDAHPAVFLVPLSRPRACWKTCPSALPSHAKSPKTAALGLVLRSDCANGWGNTYQRLPGSRDCLQIGELRQLEKRTKSFYFWR